jgi:hypothetical protein
MGQMWATVWFKSNCLRYSSHTPDCHLLWRNSVASRLFRIEDRAPVVLQLFRVALIQTYRTVRLPCSGCVVSLLFQHRGPCPCHAPAVSCRVCSNGPCHALLSLCRFTLIQTYRTVLLPCSCRAPAVFLPCSCRASAVSCHAYTNVEDRAPAVL